MNKLYRPAKRIARSRIKCKATRKQIEVGDHYIKAQGYGAFAVGSEPKSQEEADQYRFPSNPKPVAASPQDFDALSRGKTTRDDLPVLEELEPGHVLARAGSVDECQRIIFGGSIRSEGNRWLHREIESEWLSGNDGWANRHTPRSFAAAPNSPRPDSLRALDAMVEQIRGMAIDAGGRYERSARKRVRNREHGDEINVDKYYTGDVMMWGRFEQKRVVKQVVRLAVNVGANGSQGQNKLMYRGAAAIALAETLEASGVSVQLDAIYIHGRADKSHSSITTCVTVKEAGQPIDRGVLLANFADIGYMRVINLGLLVCVAHAGMTRGLGVPQGRLGCVDKLYDAIVPRIESREHAAAWFALHASEALGQ